MLKTDKTIFQGEYKHNFFDGLVILRKINYFAIQ